MGWNVTVVDACYDLSDLNSGDILCFVNRFSGQQETVCVFEVYDYYFGFWHHDRHFNVSYDYAKGKVWLLRKTVPIETPVCFKVEEECFSKPKSKSKPKPKPKPKPEFESNVVLSPVVVQSTGELPDDIYAKPIEPVARSCDNCKHNINGTCTLVRKQLCDDYIAVVVPTDEEKQNRPKLGDASYIAQHGWHNKK